LLGEEQPPEVRKANATVMPGEWNDPDDDDPRRRTAKTVKAWRTTCPLRWRIRRHGAERSGYTPEHLAAADRLRLLADGAGIGFQGERPMRPVNEPRLFRPSQGPTRTALRQYKCGMEFVRVWALFDEATRALLAAVLLANTALTRYAAQVGQRPTLVKERLVEALDRLVAWFDLRPARGAA
jgi:hypothetical protein